MIVSPRFTGYGYAIRGALWGADCIQVNALRQLTMSSYCLSYIPINIRKDFLDYIAETFRPCKLNCIHLNKCLITAFELLTLLATGHTTTYMKHTATSSNANFCAACSSFLLLLHCSQLSQFGERYRELYLHFVLMRRPIIAATLSPRKRNVHP
jgi:hypothetical protein